MPDARHVFHGHAAALSGRIVRVGEGKKAKFVKDGFIDLPAAALPTAGGRSTANLSSRQLTIRWSAPSSGSRVRPPPRKAYATMRKRRRPQVPVLCFAFPRLLIATSTRVSGAAAVPFRPPVLWKPEVITVLGRGGRS